MLWWPPLPHDVHKACIYSIFIVIYFYFISILFSRTILIRVARMTSSHHRHRHRHRLAHFVIAHGQSGKTVWCLQFFFAICSCRHDGAVTRNPMNLVTWLTRDSPTPEGNYRRNRRNCETIASHFNQITQLHCKVDILNNRMLHFESWSFVLTMIRPSHR